MTSLRKLCQQVDWSTVLEIDLHIYDSADLKGRMKCLASALKALFRQHPNLTKTEQHRSDFLFFKSMKRADYDNLFEAIIKCCPTSAKSIDLVRHHSKFIRLNPLKIIVKYLPTLLRLCHISPFKSLYVMTRAAQYLELADRLNKQYNYNTLVVFADMQPCDNLLAQLAKLSGRHTVTLQHGLYIDYTSFPNINTVNYKNTVCDYFLAWGNSTKQLIKHYHPHTQIIICGKPIIRNTKQMAPNGYLTVLFDQNLLKAYNSEMLRIAYEIQDKHQLVINLRLHPRNNPKSYNIRKTTLINRDIESSSLIIAHTTSLIHEIMRQGKAVYKYNTTIPSIEVPQEVLFSTAEELMEKFNSSNLDHNFEELAAEYIEFIDTQSLEEYRKFFTAIASPASAAVNNIPTSARLN
jgi:hypothetical protein